MNEQFKMKVWCGRLCQPEKWSSSSFPTSQPSLCLIEAAQAAATEHQQQQQEHAAVEQQRATTSLGAPS
jgi:hypothetical protein